MTKSTSAQILIDSDRVIAPISPLIFGGFAEHMGRCIYGGLYEPNSPHADARGFRRDVMAALREQGYTVMRYPGGNFVSGYNWLDGVGPREQRPRKRDLAWQSIESNQFGTDEFMDWCREAEIAPMMAVNLGTGTIEQAGALVEYCNAPTGTYYADLRAKYGHSQPHDVRYWCLGNEMDGPWQIAHHTAPEYARKALEAAKIMRWHDDSIKLTLCGSSTSQMPTCPEWDRVTLETCWEHVDYHSLHMYVGNNPNDKGETDTPSYLALSNQFEDYIDTMAATLRYVKAKNRSKHDVYLSWDEWNAHSQRRATPQSFQEGEGKWQEAPPIAESLYSLEDALVVAQWLNVFLRKADVLKVACVAQAVNILGPLITTTDALLKQTIFYPFMLMSRAAKGQSLDVLVRAPNVATQRFGDVPVLDVSASHDEATGESAVFIVNRNVSEPVTTTLKWQSVAPTRVTSAWQMAGTDPQAANTFEQPNTIVPQQINVAAPVDGELTLQLPPLSFTALRVGRV